MGIVVVASLAARVGWRTGGDDDIHLETHELGRKRGEAIEFSLCIAILNDNIFPLHVAKLAQPLPQRLDAVRDSGSETAFRYPIRGTFAGCCASAEKQSSKTVSSRPEKIF